MTDKPYHNSGAELESRTEEELREELRGSFPPGPRWLGITYELERRAAERQQKLIKRTFLVALGTLAVAALGVLATLTAK